MRRRDILGVVLLLVVAAALLAGCDEQVTPVEPLPPDTVVLVPDTVFITDTLFVVDTLYLPQDTVFITDTLFVTDTLVVVDTVYVTVPPEQMMDTTAFLDFEHNRRPVVQSDLDPLLEDGWTCAFASFAVRQRGIRIDFDCQKPEG